MLVRDVPGVRIEAGVPMEQCPRCGAWFKYGTTVRFHLYAECPKRTLRERLRYFWQRTWDSR